MIDLLGGLSAAAILGLLLANVLVDQIGFPVPAAPSLVLAGALAAGRYEWAAVLFAGSVLASLLGGTVWYWAGRRYGGRVMRLLCVLSLSPDSCVNDTQRRFDRWGSKALIVANFIPGLSVIAPPLAGAVRMRFSRFLYLSTVGSGLWVAVFLLAGMLLGRQVRALVPRFTVYGRPVALAVGALLAAYVAFKWIQRQRFLAALRTARIEVEELYRLMQDDPAPLVIDVRSPGAWARDPRWIPGAIHVSSDDIATHVVPLARDRDLILYCNCPNEASAAQVAKVLLSLGFKRVRPLRGGLDAWVAAGYPINTEVVAELARVTLAASA